MSRLSLWRPRARLAESSVQLRVSFPHALAHEARQLLVEEEVILEPRVLPLQSLLLCQVAMRRQAHVPLVDRDTRPCLSGAVVSPYGHTRVLACRAGVPIKKVLPVCIRALGADDMQLDGAFKQFQAVEVPATYRSIEHGA